jgi:sugar/nucleoside kinase (ribokinase family)
MNFDLLSIGDASYDVFLTPIESETLCRLDERKSFICLGYGDKIPVREIEFTVGGNAANNAVGVRRLGVKVANVLTLGGDAIGGGIIQKLKDEGVNTTFVIIQPTSKSNYSTIISYMGERTILSYKSPRSYEFPVKLPKAPWVYLTSMGDTFQPFFNHLYEWLILNPEVHLAFNPGSRQLRAGFDAIAKMISRTKILFVNRQEAEGLVNFSGSEGKERELLNALIKLGVACPVVTDGENGSFVFDGQKYLKCNILPVDAYERTGAGDAFGSGFLAAIIKGKGFGEALLWGTVNSASVIGYTGSQKGLLRENEMVIWLERAKSSGVRVEEF